MEVTYSRSDCDQDCGPARATLKRNISALAIIGLGLSICNGWAAMSSTIVIGLGNGGTPVVLYGLIGVSFINLFLAATLSELAAAWPSAGGQYVWASKLGGPRVAFAVGWATIFEWIAIVASVVIISAEVIFGLVETYHQSFHIQRWHVFLIYMAVNTISALNNLFVLSSIPRMGTVFLVFSTVIYLVIMITCPAAAEKRQPHSFVWGQYDNNTGWSSKFVVVAMGLINPSYVFAGLDGAVHIAEDCLDAARSIPYSLFATVVISLCTGLSFSIALLYSIQDVDKAQAAELPFLEIIVQATRSKAVGAVFMVAFLCVLIVSANSVQQASSRLIWSFARDDGIPFSRAMARVNPRLRVPVLPVIVSWTGVTLLGVLYIASQTVYSSIIACCIILGNLSYAILSLQLLVARRRTLPRTWLRLGPLGWVANIVTVLWAGFTTVMWLFPGTPNPNGSEMNYSVAVLTAMALIALLDWVLYARKKFARRQDETDTETIQEVLAVPCVVNGSGKRADVEDEREREKEKDSEGGITVGSAY